MIYVEKINFIVINGLMFFLMIHVDKFNLYRVYTLKLYFHLTISNNT
jgi:hypothetical protein